jgi:hypothetical protein
MRLPLSGGCVLVAALAGIVAGCGERHAASPLSPSLLSSPASEDGGRRAAAFAPRRADDDGDGYDDGEPPADPGADPVPDPGTPPTPDPNQPPVEGLPPAPIQLTISVIGSFGAAAFAPNPLQAAIGNTIVWMNNDFITHDIVLDDGTPIGILAPGQSSLPIPLVTETANYHCTLHPSMVGQVVPIPAEPPPPTDPTAEPTPDPTYPPPAAPDPYDGGDGGSPGYDDYYLKAKR